MQNKAPTVQDLVFGAHAIHQETGIPRRQVYYLARLGQLPGAFRIANQIVLSRAAHRAAIAERIAAAANRMP
jgi:hypothetical protein